MVHATLEIRTGLFVSFRTRCSPAEWPIRKLAPTGLLQTLRTVRVYTTAQNRAVTDSPASFHDIGPVPARDFVSESYLESAQLK